MIVSKRTLGHYAGSVAVIVAATLARQALNPALHSRAPLIFCFIAVSFAAWLGGLGPGLVALVLGGMTAVYFFMTPGGTFLPDRSESQIGLGIYYTTGLIIVLLAQAQRSARRKAEASTLEALDQQAKLETEIARRELAERALREADARKDEFLAVLAHEIRNPLASIRNSLRLMERPGPAADGRVVAFDAEAERELAERQVAHLARLVDDLMDISRITRGRIELRKEPVDLVGLLERAVETVHSAVDQRGHVLSVVLPTGPVPLEADPTRLEQIIGNLLNNAVKYTPPGGLITASVRSEGGEAILTVLDTGLGLSTEILPRVFDMFVQDGRHAGHAQGGLGIGLGLSRSLVELHGGRISARSDGPGLGSEFEVRLPLAAEGVAEAMGSRLNGRMIRPSIATRRRVLVVDDNEDVARSLARVLERMYGQEVSVAYDGPSALGLLDKFQPEVILLDISMPEMDGYEVARRIRRRPEFAETLVVALTGWGQDADRKRSEEAGIDRHLIKPIDPDLLGELIAGPRPETTLANGL
jgi:signal transduction histidine kinase/ActR/RegA family two-component response regulator